MTRTLWVGLLLAVTLLGCGDDDGHAHTDDGGDQDSGGSACPNLAGDWTVDEHCGGAPLIGLIVPVTQVGCQLTTGGAFAGFTGTIDESGDFTLSGVANGSTIDCTGTANTSTITQTCTDNCNVVLSK